MGSSAKTGKFFIRGSQKHVLHKCAIWDRTPPHLHIKCSLYVCRRVHGSQIFKWNSIISICSKVIAFSVLLPPHGPCGPHIVPIISMLSPHHPHGPHKVPTSPHGCGLCCLHPMLSPLSPCHPCCPHVIPTLSRRSVHYPQSPR